MPDPWRRGVKRRGGERSSFLRSSGRRPAALRRNLEPHQGALRIELRRFGVGFLQSPQPPHRESALPVPCGWQPRNVRVPSKASRLSRSRAASPPQTPGARVEAREARASGARAAAWAMPPKHSLINPSGGAGAMSPGISASATAPFDLREVVMDLPPIAARGLGAEPRIGGGPVPRTASIDELASVDAEVNSGKPKPKLKLSKQSLKAVELSRQVTAKKKELDQEKHLQAQIKELQRQLDMEKKRRKETAKARERSQSRRNLVIAVHKLPYEIIDHAAVEPARGLNSSPPSARMFGSRLPSSEGASSESRWELVEKRTVLNVLDGINSLSKSFNVTVVGTIDAMATDEESLAAIREKLLERNCVPLFTKGTAAAGEPAPVAQLHTQTTTLSEDTLWPLFHYIPLSSLEADFSDTQRRQWDEYERMNRVFADAVSSHVKQEAYDLVWVHDYHLMLVPSMLREQWSKLKIGWFLHTPFPSSEMYLTLPRRREILRGVLSANLLGFHIYDYVRHFMNACMRVLATDITVDHRYVKDSLNRQASAVDAFPNGVDPARYKQALSVPAVKDLIIDLQRRFDGKRIVLGLDLLDFIKGIPHKLMAYEKFLTDYPAWRGRVTLVQIAVPPEVENAPLQKLKNKVHKLVGRINGRFGTLEHSPIHYLDQAISFEQQVALAFLADVAMITSLREGMSHTALEFIACQERSHGVLILSEFAGAAQALGSGAIMVNPFNTDDMAAAIDTALGMSAREREERHARMLEYVNKFTASWWAENFTTEMVTQEHDLGIFSNLDALSPPKALPAGTVLERYRGAQRRLIVTGLLGVLMNYTCFKNLEPIADEVYHSLAALCADPRNTVVMITGRERALAQQWLGNLPVWLAAENGLFYRLGGRGAEWQSALEGVDQSWMAGVRPVFKYFEQRTPCTFTEVQEFTMTWHYREADEDFGEIQASDLQLHLDKVLGNMPVEVSLDAKQVQVRPYGVSKGAVLEHILEELTGYNRDAASQGAAAPNVASMSTILGPPAAELPEDVTLPVAAIAGGVAAASAVLQAGVLQVEGRERGGSVGSHDAQMPTSAHAAAGSMCGVGPAPSLTSTVASTAANPPPGGAPPRAPVEMRSYGSDLDALSIGGSVAPTFVSRSKGDIDFVLCIGDLATRDEDLFSNFTANDSPYVDHLPAAADVFTVRVGEPEPTQARYGVADTKAVEELLKALAAASAAAPPTPVLEGQGTQLGTPEVRASRHEDDSFVTCMPSEPLHALPSALSITSCSPASSSDMLPFVGRKIAFFLDYDGTLTPIVAQPEDAVMSDSMREIVRSLAALYPTAIVSGRPIATAHGFVKLDELYYAGNHGMDIAGPSNSLIKHQPVDDMYRPALESAHKKLTEMLRSVQGVLIEDNTFSLSVHYRAVANEEGRTEVSKAVDDVLGEMPMLRKMPGKMVHELRPEVDWNKGRAVEWLLDNLKEEYGEEDIFPIYIGDDVTDEDAFRTLRNTGAIHNGLGIIVTDTSAAEGSTDATYQLRNPEEVGLFLEWFTQPSQQHLAWQNKKQYTGLEGGLTKHSPRESSGNLDPLNETASLCSEPDTPSRGDEGI